MLGTNYVDTGMYSGGGFMANNSQDANRIASPSSTSKRSAVPASLKPCTIKQLLEAEQNMVDGPYIIDGRELSNVSFIGCIRRAVPVPTSTTYTVDDGTGATEVRIWHDAEESEESVEQRTAIRENVWVHVYGQIRPASQGKRNITGLSIRAIEDFNELSHHFLHVILTHMQATKGFIGKGSATSGMSSGVKSLNYQQHNATAHDPFSPVQRSVMNAILAHQNDQAGVMIAMIKRSLYGQFAESDVAAAVDWLIDEGHIYTTIDEQHVKAGIDM